MARAKKKQELSFEEALEKLETIVAQLEKGEISLDESLAFFSEGMELSKVCLNKLNYVEEQIDKILTEENNKISERPLEMQEDL